MSHQQITLQAITARDAYDTADAIITALPNASRRALAGEINDLFLYLECQMRSEGPRLAPEGQREDMAVKTDAQLQRDVMNELQWEPTIHAAEIGVAVRDGVVTLSGYVDSYAKKGAAERAVKRVSGVKAVAEEIKVTIPGTYRRADEDIARAASNILDWDIWIPRDRVKVMVQDGRVTLTGDVDWYHQKAHAEDAIRHLIGVRGVTNSITIKPPVPTVKVFEVKSKIEDALRRNARLLRDAEKIRVEISGSKVVLSGSVGSWADREEAEYAAWSAPGVSEVDNQIVIALESPTTAPVYR